MKKKISVLCLVLVIILSVSISYSSGFADEKCVYLGGMPAGFSISTRGAHVVGLCDVVTEQGVESPAKNADVKIGDVILKICNIEINNAKDIENVVVGDNLTEVQIQRDGEVIYKTIKPAKDMNGKFKLGVFIKDNISGIGTITYIDGDRFASLGHAVIGENGEVLDILGGELFNCNITGVVKGERGKAGELRGVFLRDKPIAKVEKNLTCGVYGCIQEGYDLSSFEKICIGTAKIGDAYIYTTIDGKVPIKYDISIVKNENYGVNKNYVVEIKDERLLDSTGGIVQGMSGSPIVQNGKLVGAITHVFINDPARGFGISIDNMINN